MGNSSLRKKESSWFKKTRRSKLQKRLNLDLRRILELQHKTFKIKSFINDGDKTKISVEF